MRTLHATQTWMLGVITHPQGPCKNSDAHVDVPQSGAVDNRIESVITTTTEWLATDRLEIYWNAYFARLQECLSEEYPILRHTVSDEVFDQFVFEYLQACPPSSYTLGRLGERLATFLRTTRPPRDEHVRGPDWADFVSDLAAFEWTLSEVFDGPGDEHMIRLPNEALVECQNDRLPDATLTLTPCLTLCAYQFPVHLYHAGMKAGETCDIPHAERSFVAVSRRDFTVQHHSLSSTEFFLLQELQSGISLGSALERICAANQAASDDVATNITQWFATWTRAGFILRVNI